MKVEAAPDLLVALRTYADRFAAHPPAILRLFRPDGGSESNSGESGMPDATGPGGAAHVAAVGEGVPAPQPPHDTPAVYNDASFLPFAPDSDRGLGILLLAAALHKPSGTIPFGAGAARLISVLYLKFGTDVFRLNRLPFEALRAAVEAQGDAFEFADEEERARVPGILRSVCDFFYRVGPLTKWLAGAPDWETRVGELSQEIYWMGAQSRTRTKARLFLWLACQIEGFGIRHPQAAAFAWPVSEGHMRFLFDILKPPRGGKAGAVPPSEERAALFAGFARTVFPEEPWRLYAPLEAFLKPDGRGDMACRTVQGGCRPCPLSARCPAAKYHLARER